MKSNLIYVIIVIGIFISGILIYLSHLPSESDLIFSGREYFGTDRFIIKMKSDTVIDIFNNWDTNYFKYCEYKDDSLHISYGSDYAMIILWGSEKAITDTNFFRHDPSRSRFIFFGNKDTIYMPVRVITQYIEYKNNNSIN